MRLVGILRVEYGFEVFGLIIITRLYEGYYIFITICGRSRVYKENLENENVMSYLEEIV